MRQKTKKQNPATTPKINIVSIIVFTIMVLIASMVTFWLFYRQCVESMLETGRYHSDMKAYILEMQGLDSGYSFPYPILFKLAAAIHLVTSSLDTGAELAMALATMLLNSAAMIALKLMLDRHVGTGLQQGRLDGDTDTRRQKTLSGQAVDDTHERPSMPDGFADARNQQSVTGNSVGTSWKTNRSSGQGLTSILISVVAVSLFFVSMVYPPTGIYLPGIPYKYLGVFTPNPFHNATYMAARPFAILAFFKYGELLPLYEQKNAWKEHTWDYVLFSLYLLLSTMAKPSFTIVLVGVAGLLMLWRLFRSRFQNFLPTLWLGVCFLPTFIDLLYQFRGVFVPQEGQEGGIGVTFGNVWMQYCSNIPLAIGLAIGFPLLVLLLNYKELKKDSIYRFSWQIYVMSFLMAFGLYEKGFREMDFNFAWGYMYGIFFAFIGAMLVLLRATAEAVETAKTASKVQIRRNYGVIGIQWLAYLWHLVCGLYYFWGFLQGAMYY